MTTQVTEETFEQEVRSSERPLVLEFYAPWCGNCRRIAPTLAVLAAEFAGRVRFVTVNVEEEQALPARFGVTSTPTIVVLAPGGSTVTSTVGAQTETVLRSVFELAAGLVAEPDTAGPPADVPSWAPADACALPLADQPARVAEFGDVFEAGLTRVNRPERTWLQLTFRGGDPDLEAGVRDLMAREAQCCTFFDFLLTGGSEQLTLDIRVPQDKVQVLDGMESQATATLSQVA